MTHITPPNRCRLILIAPIDEAADIFAPRLAEAIAGGDVASLILPAWADEGAFQTFATPIVRMTQEAGVAAIIAEDTRAAGRIGADGIHLHAKPDGIREAVERSRGKMIVGAGGAATRDDALELGEAQPDYIFFGRFGYDTKPEPHKRNLALGRWWAEMVAIPCVVMGGSEIASVADVADTGVEFVALGNAIFGEGIDPREAVRTANALLDETAPGSGV
jgi:thiamine-phosphate pyrophosphorylase